MTGRSRAARFLAAGLVAALAAGCASKPKITPVIPAEELYAKAEERIARERWDQAAEELRKLVDSYPYHELSPHAELRLGDMYFLDRRYAEAAATFEQFLKLRPSHPLAPYATYLLGSSYFHQRNTFDRDPTFTRKAAEVFDRLVKTHPGSEHAGRAQARLAEARGELAEHEIYIGNFYFREKRYEAALKRYTKTTTAYPEQAAAHRARLRAGECQLKLERREAARTTLSHVIHRAADAELEKRAAALLEKAGIEPLPASAMAPPRGPAEASSRALVR